MTIPRRTFLKALAAVVAVPAAVAARFVGVSKGAEATGKAFGKNPLFSRQLGHYDGIILHESVAAAGEISGRVVFVAPGRAEPTTVRWSAPDNAEDTVELCSIPPGSTLMAVEIDSIATEFGGIRVAAPRKVEPDPCSYADDDWTDADIEAYVARIQQRKPWERILG